MKYFGGTPIAYFAVFGMKDLLEELVGDPIKVDEARVKAGEPKWLDHVEASSRPGELAPSKRNTLLDGMPMQTQYFNYHGSTTSPPCSQNVEWFLLTAPVPMALHQMKKLRALR